MKQVLVKPVVTEKSTLLQDLRQQFVFVVNKNANKLEIKDAIETMYGVTVEAVNTTIIPSKEKSRFTKSGVIVGRKSGYKKAYITLAAGDVIDIYANI